MTMPEDPWMNDVPDAWVLALLVFAFGVIVCALVGVGVMLWR